MSSDMDRIRTFLAYRGFQCAPLWSPARFETPLPDFVASRKGVASIVGTVISIGEQTNPSDRFVHIAGDDGERDALRSHMARQLEQSDRRLSGAGSKAALPKVVAVVNHDPSGRFEDLTAALDQYPAKTPHSIDLLIWFDEFREDRMLFCRSHQMAYQKLIGWFHVA